MTDYKKMYTLLISACEDAINLLIEAQQKCEELYILSCEDEPSEVDALSVK